MTVTNEIKPPPATVAVDAMGGDRAPQIIIDGLIEAARLHTTTSFRVFGDAKALTQQLSGIEQIKLINAPHALPSGERPRNALKSDYSETSMAQAFADVAAGKAAAVVSAGDTGAMMALGMRHFGLFDGIGRPAIASIMPTKKNETIVLDLGANLTVGGDNLLQFGILGTVLSETMLAMRAPRIGLLNIGSENSKGPVFLQEADALMRAHPWPGAYMGFVEPYDLAEGAIDVLVCDGYAGNIMLKSIEATTSLVATYTLAAFRETWLSRLAVGFAARPFAKLRRRLDARRYNGAVMAGLTRVCVKSHGGADEVSFAHALELAIDMVQQGYAKRVPELLAVEKPQPEFS